MLRRKTLLVFCTFLLVIFPIQAQSQTIDSRLEAMTLEQKVAQMFVMSFFGSELNFPVQELLTEWQVGAVVFLPSNLENPQQITRLTNDIQQTLLDNNSIPAFIAVDQEGGIIAHLEEGFTRWAVPSLLTATQNPDLAYQFGEALAEEYARSDTREEVVAIDPHTYHRLADTDDDRYYDEYYEEKPKKNGARM